MDHRQLPRGTDGFAAGNTLFGDSQQYNAYDNPFPTGTDQPAYDASWGVNASNYPAPSRTHQPVPSWPQNASHLPTNPATLNGQPSPYGPPLSHSPAPYGQNSFNHYGAPQTFQYGQPQYDPALLQQRSMNQNFNAYSPTQYAASSAGTIAPQALQHESRSPAVGRNAYDAPSFQLDSARSNKSLPPKIVDQAALAASIPASNNTGYFSIINFDNLATSTKSERMGNYLNIGTETHHWDVNRAALPAYIPRKSRNDLRKVAGNDAKLLAKIGKKVVKTPKSSIIAPRAAPTTSANGSPTAEKIKHEGDSSSAEDSSSDDDDASSYTSDDTAEPSPLKPKRPESPKEATEYDTIKALWRTKHRAPNAESIRTGLVEFWEIAKTIRDRWKADATAVTDAEAKNRANELPLLRSRVKDQRDMMEVAFKAALKHGHRDIVALFSQNQSLMFICYQFLLDRVKDDDWNGPLSRATLEIISLSTTLKAETYEKTHLVKVIPRFVKKGDAKTQFYAKRIVANASSNTSDKTIEPEAKKAGTAGSPSVKRESEPVAGVKRSASTAGEGGAQKKVATTASKVNGGVSANKLNSAAKRPSTTTDATKAATTTAAPAVKAKQVTAKPSGLFASLQSASKKPGTSNASRTASTGGIPASTVKATGAIATQSSAPKSTFSFADTMANLSKPKEEKPAPKPVQQIPQETPEEKAKRLRKESRRHLHVTFKKADELVEVRIFHHDPDEEEGHDASQVRDVGDVGGEGRMFKQQHHMMDIDEDEEPTIEEEKLVEFTAPTEINFSEVDEEERKRNFARYGGGKLEPETDERAKREHYEANNLLVFYATPSDIPPNPREPSDPYNGEPVTSVKKIAAPEEKWSTRARQKKHGYVGQQYGAPSQGSSQGFDLSQILKTQQYSQAPPAQAQPTPPVSSIDISSLLASLTQAGRATSTPPQPPVNNLPMLFQPPAPPINHAQPPPAAATGQPDLAAILAQITQNQQAAAPAAPQPPAMGGGGYGYNPAATAPNVTPLQPQTSTYEHPDRKQWREAGGAGESQPAWNKRRDAGSNPKYKSKTCKYWLEGRCQKGDDCTYKHAE